MISQEPPKYTWYDFLFVVLYRGDCELVRLTVALIDDYASDTRSDLNLCIYTLAVEWIHLLPPQPS